MLTSSDLAAMRETLEDSLIDSAVIGTAVWVSDGGGGGTTTFSPSGTAECRIAPVNATEHIAGERVHPDTEYVFTFPYDTAVPSDAIITLGSRDYTVTGLREPRSWATSLRVEAKEI